MISTFLLGCMSSLRHQFLNTSGALRQVDQLKEPLTMSPPLGFHTHEGWARILPGPQTQPLHHPVVGPLHSF